MLRNPYSEDIQRQLKSNQQKQIRNLDQVGAAYSGGSGCCCHCHGSGASGGGYSGGGASGGSHFVDTGLSRPIGGGLSSGVKEFIKEMKSDIKQVGGSKPSKTGSDFIKRTEIVKDVMKKRGVSLMEASSIVKKEGLYKKQ